MSIVMANTPESTSTLTNIGPKNIQQAAIDICMDQVWAICGQFVLSEDIKINTTKSLMTPDEDGFYIFTPGSYEVSFDHDIDIGPDEAGLVVTRSSLVRNGLFCASGIWDPSFRGRGGCCLHVPQNVTARIKKGTRIAQFVLWKVINPAGIYDGSYGLDVNGVPKPEESRYYTKSNV